MASLSTLSLDSSRPCLQNSHYTLQTNFDTNDPVQPINVGGYDKKPDGYTHTHSSGNPPVLTDGELYVHDGVFYRPPSGPLQSRLLFGMACI